MTTSFWSIAADDPGRVAVVEDGGRTATYGELADAANRMTHGLRALGLDGGDVLAVAVPNCLEWFELYLGAWQSGLYFLPINCHLAAAEVAYIVGDSGASVFVAHARLGAGAVDAGAACPPERRFAVGGDLAGFTPYAALGEGQLSVRPAERAAGQVMMYSSGTTGRPKGVRRPRIEGDPDAIVGLTAGVTCSGFGIEPDGVHLVCGPLYHAGPFLGAVNTLHTGHTLVVMDHWEAERTLQLIDRYRVTCSQMVPTMFHRLLALPDDIRNRYDVSSLQSVLHTGAPCPVEIKRRMMEWWGPVLYETYGGTEAAATIAKPHRWLKRPGTVGRAIHGVHVKILDDDGHELPAGTPGLIYISTERGGAPEYHKDPEKTASIRRGDFVTLGDVGYLDEDGWLFLCDRQIDMVISGGVNIYPAEVEAALLTHPAVADVAVIGVPNEEWGEEVRAVVETADGYTPSADLERELIQHCRSAIAHFKCPRAVDFRKLPRLPNGKLLKRCLREDYLATQPASG